LSSQKLKNVGGSYSLPSKPGGNSKAKTKPLSRSIFNSNNEEDDHQPVHSGYSEHTAVVRVDSQTERTRYFLNCDDDEGPPSHRSGLEGVEEMDEAE